MIGREEIEAAAQRIAGRVVQTPVLATEAFGLPLEMKLEQLQHTGSFKVRGAFNTLLAAPPPAAGIVAASGGNHGAAVGHAAAALGIPAQIFVPEIAGPAKIELIRCTGAALEVVPGDYADALAAARAFEAETGAVQVHAYDAPETVAGQGTLFREWEAQGLAADTLLVATGGGGLLAGAMAWFGRARRIVAVEPEACPTLHAALAAGAPVEVQPSGIAANALGARQIGEICFALARETDTRAFLVSDAAIEAARAALWRAHRLLVEPAGAAALAALLSGAYRPEPGERVAVLVCGANPAENVLSDPKDLTTNGSRSFPSPIT